MKKILMFFVMFIASLSLCSCGPETVVYDGYENFSKGHSDYEINYFLLPSDDFVSRFEYVDIDYHYEGSYKSYFSLTGTEKSLISIDYEPDVYQNAKQFCLNEMELSETVVLEHNGYTFIENIEHKVGQVDSDGNYVSEFPEWFNMLVYNDTKCELIFIGFFGEDVYVDDAEDVKANWGEFVEEYFGDIHDWD